MNEGILELNRASQSVWYDNLSRAVLRSGELAEIISSGVTGLTSNPAIFNKAIGDSSDYDSDMKVLAAQNLNAEQICERLMIGDVAEAADLLLDVYQASEGHDGYASIEVSPTLAYDTQGTIASARSIWAALNRPNIMIKVPATVAGLPAIETLLSEGINVNVTLIFSLSRYSQVLECYLRAMEQRLANKESLQISSVASFFVSRVDTIVEQESERLVKAGACATSDFEGLKAEIAIANSLLAYEHFIKVQQSGRFQKLLKAGARIQRPLWASTSTKNPKLDPLHYVARLAFAETVNTVPPVTLNAVLAADNFKLNSELNFNSARLMLEQLASAGVSFDYCLNRLEIDGVKAFADSFESLLSSISKKI